MVLIMYLFSEYPYIFLGGQLHKKQHIFHSFYNRINRLPFLCLIIFIVTIKKLSVIDLPLHAFPDLTNCKFFAYLVQKPALAKHADTESTLHDCTHHGDHGLLWEDLRSKQRVVERIWADNLGGVKLDDPGLDG